MMGVRLSPAEPFTAIRLLDEPSSVQLQIIEFVLETYIREGEWPVFDYVEGRFACEDVDVWEQLRLLTADPIHRYSAVALGRQQIPDENDRVALTMLGIWQAEVMQRVKSNLPFIFLIALNEFAKMRRETPRSPTVARSFEISSSQLIAKFEGSPTEPETTPQLLAELLDREPATWLSSGNTTFDGSWIRTVPRTVSRFYGIDTLKAYLDRLVEFLTVPLLDPAPAVQSPLALVGAIDYLNNVWRVAQPRQKALFTLHSAQGTTQLAFPANNQTEFEARLSALGDILRSYVLPTNARAKGRDKHMANLEGYLVQILPESSLRIEHAIATFQNVINVRDAGQHARAGAKGPAAMAALGVGYPPASWPGAWATISTKTVEALESIREELATLT